MRRHFVIGALLALAIGCPGETFAQQDPPATKVQGRIIDAQGAVVKQATAESFEVDSLIDTAAKGKALGVTNGTFEVSLGSQGAIVMATAPGFGWSWQTAWAQAPASEMDLVLTPPTLLSGEVVDAQGKPVANAEVFVQVATTIHKTDSGSQRMAYISGEPAKAKFNSRTDAAGRFSISAFPEGATAMLGVKAEGKALKPDKAEIRAESLAYSSGQKDIRLVLEDAGAVAGKIIFPAETQAKPIASVRLVPEATSRTATVQQSAIKTEPDGSFFIGSVSPGSYQLLVLFDPVVKGTPAAFASGSTQVTVEAGKTNSDVTVHASSGGVLEVTVLSKDKREPLEGVSIQAGTGMASVSALSGPDGKAFLRLAPREYQIFASKKNLVSVNLAATVAEGATNSLQVEIAAPRIIRGIVRSPSGAPAPGLQVQLVGMFGGLNEKILTRQDGSFQIPMRQPGFSSSDRKSCVFVRDPEKNLAAAQDLEEDTETLELQLVPGVIVSGSAECDGAPVTNATAALVFWTGNSGMHLRGLESALKEPGKFEIKALPPGRRYGLYVSGKGYGQKYVDLGTGSEQDNKIAVDPVELRKANLKLAGTVLDENEKPVSRASLYISGDSQPNQNIFSDKDGKFSIDGVCEGSIRIFANAQGMQANVAAEAGDTNVVIRMGAASEPYSDSAVTRKLAGILKAPDGSPAAGISASVFPSQDMSRKTDADGKFSFNWRLEQWQLSQGGDAWLVFRDSKNNLAAAESVSDDATNMVVQLKPGMTIQGKVLDADGKPLTHASVGLWISAGRTYSDFAQGAIKLDAQGQYEVQNLPHGPKYIAYASAKDYGRSQREIDYESEAKTAEVPEFRLKPATMIVSGRVLKADDKPASGVQVMINGEDQPQANTSTDKQGVFTLKACEGKLRVFANGENSYANVETEGGDTNVVLTLRSYSSMASSETPRRASLTGKPLPTLAPFGFAPEAIPGDKPLLVCLVDGEQRPSRRSARILSEQHEKIKGKGIGVVAIQTAAISPETMKSWTNATPLAFPICCIAEKSAANRWVTDVQSLPWLILRDAKGKVVAEGFAMEELDAKLEALGK